MFSPFVAACFSFSFISCMWKLDIHRTELMIEAQTLNVHSKVETDPKRTKNIVITTDSNQFSRQLGIFCMQ